jgi:hypothetical protein
MPTIKKPNQYFDVKLYTGTNANTSINSYGFSPDLIWIKNRDNVENHHLVDSVRGNNKFLISNSTAAERTGSLNNGNNQVNLTSTGFDIISNGFNDELNITGRTYVAWGWDAGSSTVTNTSGSISSNVSVNATAGFSVVTYTGNGTAGATVGHGLGVKPSMIIVKNRSGVYAWPVFHTSIDAATGGNGAYLTLSSTAAKTDTTTGDAETVFGNGTQWVTPTSTVFTIGGWAGVNTNTSNYVAYCWAEIAGFSKFGSYTGNGSTDGPFLYTGFRPRFIMIKCTSNADSWYMLDTSRSTYNATNERLFANASSAESSGDAMDILSNGFKNRSSTTLNNLNGGTYIYAAFAEAPFKFSNAR